MKNGYINWLKEKPNKVIGIFENAVGHNKETAKSVYVFASKEDAENFKNEHLAGYTFGNAFQDPRLGNQWVVPINDQAQMKLKEEYAKSVQYSLEGEETLQEYDKQLRLIAEARDKLDKFNGVEIDSTGKNKITRMSYKVVPDRISNMANLLSNREEGAFFHVASSAMDMMLSVYNATNYHLLSRNESETIQEAQLKLLETNNEGRFTSGLKADANFADYIIQQYKSEDLRGTRRSIIREDVELLLNGGPRRIIDKTTPNNLPSIKATGANKKDSFLQKRFFPDHHGKSDTDMLVLQGGGMAQHSSMRVLRKEKDNSTPGGYRYFYTKVDAGGGVEEMNWEHQTGSGIYTTEIKPIYRLTTRYGMKVLDTDSDGNPIKLTEAEIQKINANPALYQEHMKATLFALIDAERQILFYKNPTLSVDHGESSGITAQDRAEWNFWNNKIKALRGEKVPERSKITPLQQSGNCAAFSYMLTTMDLVGEDLGYDMLQSFKTYNIDNAREQLRQREEQLKSKKETLQNLLKMQKIEEESYLKEARVQHELLLSKVEADLNLKNGSLTLKAYREGDHHSKYIPRGIIKCANPGEAQQLTILLQQKYGITTKTEIIDGSPAIKLDIQDLKKIADHSKKLESVPGKLTSKVEIYSARGVDENGHRVAIAFPTPLERNEFMKNMKAEAQKHNVDLTDVFEVYDSINPNVVYIKNSKNTNNNLGTYESNLGALSLYLGNESFSKEFASQLGLKGEATLSEGAIFFDHKILPLQPDRSKSIKTQYTPPAPVSEKAVSLNQIFLKNLNQSMNLAPGLNDVIHIIQSDGSNTYIMQFNSEKEAEEFSAILGNKYNIKGASGNNKHPAQHVENDKRYGVVLTDKNVDTLKLALEKESASIAPLAPTASINSIAIEAYDKLSKSQKKDRKIEVDKHTIVYGISENNEWFYINIRTPDNHLINIFVKESSIKSGNINTQDIVFEHQDQSKQVVYDDLAIRDRWIAAAVKNIQPDLRSLPSLKPIKSTKVEPAKDKNQLIKEINLVRKEFGQTFTTGVACRKETDPITGLFVNTDPGPDSNGICRESLFQAEKLKQAIADGKGGEILAAANAHFKGQYYFQDANAVVNYVAKMKGADASMFTRNSGLQHIYSNNWRAEGRLKAMYDVQRQFIEHGDKRGQDYGTTLLAFYQLNRAIIESSSTDPYWGVKAGNVNDGGQGLNDLGTIHMVIAREMAEAAKNAQNGKFTYCGRVFDLNEVNKAKSTISKSNLPNMNVDKYVDGVGIITAPTNKSLSGNTLIDFAQNAIKQMQAKGEVSGHTYSRSGEKIEYGISQTNGGFYINGATKKIYIQGNTIKEDGRRINYSTGERSGWGEWAMNIVNNDLAAGPKPQTTALSLANIAKQAEASVNNGEFIWLNQGNHAIIYGVVSKGVFEIRDQIDGGPSVRIYSDGRIEENGIAVKESNWANSKIDIINQDLEKRKTQKQNVIQTNEPTLLDVVQEAHMKMRKNSSRETQSQKGVKVRYHIENNGDFVIKGTTICVNKNGTTSVVPKMVRITKAGVIQEDDRTIDYSKGERSGWGEWAKNVVLSDLSTLPTKLTSQPIVRASKTPHKPEPSVAIKELSSTKGSETLDKETTRKIKAAVTESLRNSKDEGEFVQKLNSAIEKAIPGADKSKFEDPTFKEQSKALFNEFHKHKNSLTLLDSFVEAIKSLFGLDKTTTIINKATETVSASAKKIKPSHLDQVKTNTTSSSWGLGSSRL